MEAVASIRDVTGEQKGVNDRGEPRILYTVQADPVGKLVTWKKDLADQAYAAIGQQASIVYEEESKFHEGSGRTFVNKYLQSLIAGGQAQPGIQIQGGSFPGTTNTATGGATTATVATPPVTTESDREQRMTRGAAIKAAIEESKSWPESERTVERLFNAAETFARYIWNGSKPQTTALPPVAVPLPDITPDFNGDDDIPF